MDRTARALDKCTAWRDSRRRDAVTQRPCGVRLRDGVHIRCPIDFDGALDGERADAVVYILSTPTTAAVRCWTCKRSPHQQIARAIWRPARCAGARRSKATPQTSGLLTGRIVETAAAVPIAAGQISFRA